MGSSCGMVQAAVRACVDGQLEKLGSRATRAAALACTPNEQSTHRSRLIDGGAARQHGQYQQNAKPTSSSAAVNAACSARVHVDRHSSGAHACGKAIRHYAILLSHRMRTAWLLQPQRAADQLFTGAKLLNVKFWRFYSMRAVVGRERLRVRAEWGGADVSDALQPGPSPAIAWQLRVYSVPEMYTCMI